MAELLFLPVYCYALFIYGESIGTCSVLCAIWCYLMANRPEGKVWQKGLLWSAVALFMGLAYATRNVLLVVWIAMVIMQILVLLRSKKWQGTAGALRGAGSHAAGENDSLSHGGRTA